MTSARCVAIYSPAPQSGKSTLARIIEARGYRRAPLAGSLKQMLAVLLAALGYDAATVERMIDGDMKETVIPGLGKTPRYMMQTLGTEWGRDLVADDIWIMPVVEALRRGERIVIDDMRFRNEFDAIAAAGGVLVKIVRPGAAGSSHSSDGALDGLPFHHTITNDGDLADYMAMCQAFCDQASL